MAKRRIEDFQKNKVFAWQRSAFTHAEHYQGSLSLEECADMAAKMYGARVIVKKGREGTSAMARISKKQATITLPSWAMNPMVVAHEVAHWHNYRFCKSSSAHGGVFMYFYIDLLARFCGKDAEALTKSALEFGLRVTRPMGLKLDQPEQKAA